MTGAAHEFDFWIGDWDVFGPEGKQVGHNTITSMFVTPSASGMLHEHWHGNGGVEGRSINAYDATRGRWHQTWMDSTGDMLVLEGGLVDGAMVLESLAPGEGGTPTAERQRITWTRVSDPDGAEVRQLWESSNDGGATWTVAFDGWYRRR
jgi:hypothetical protein